ncbi:7730_t:CDS:2, partial [Funneliformis caledonium]
DSKKFTNAMIEDVKFMTIYCKFGATAQIKFLEGKYPFHPIYSRDLYAVIQKFQPTKKSLSNDIAKVSDWLDLQKEKDSRWTKISWAHCYTAFKFTGGMIATSQIESMNACLKRPTMLKIHRDEINQSLYYIANLVNQEEANEKFPNEVSNKAEAIDLLQVTLEQMIKFVRYHNITEICKELDGSKEPFLVADKFLQENKNITSSHNGSVLFLSNFDQTGKDIYEERLGVLERKLIYGKLHGIYKKALQKALQNNHKMQQLIDLLQEFTEEEDSNNLSDLEEVLQDNNTSDKENEDPAMVTL